MILVVGLGNPGEKYATNRHNAGFIFTDFLYKNSQLVKPWKYDKYILSEIAEVTLHATRYTLHAFLAKPQTFMNKSGDAVKKILSTLHVTRYTLCVVHDDLDLDLGNFKIQKGTGPKVHNGLESIEAALGTKDFLRVRIGVDNRKGEFRAPGETYVLKDFDDNESAKIQTIFPAVVQRLMENLLSII